MNSAHHPWLTEIQLSFSNRLRRARRDWGESLFYFCSWLVFAAIATWAMRQLDGDKIGLVFTQMLAWPILVFVLYVALGFIGARGAKNALASEWRYGWWGAKPIAEAARLRTQRWVIAVFIALFMLGVLFTLLSIAAVSDFSKHWLIPMSLCLGMGMPIGACLAMLKSSRTQRASTAQSQTSAKQPPLFTVPFLNHRSAPNLALWMRMQTLQRWRAGGRWWPFLSFGLLIPFNQAPQSMAGLIVIGLSVIWIGFALQSSQQVIADARRLLQATPLRFSQFARAAWRFGMWIWLIGSTGLVSGLFLQSASPTILILTSTILLMLVGLSFVLYLRFWQRPHIAQSRLLAEVVFMLALFELVAPPAPLIAYPVLIWLHLSKASKNSRG